MYSLDINFIKGRSQPKSTQSTRTTKITSFAARDMTPIYVGLGAGLASLALVLAGWGLLSTQNSGLERDVAKLDQDLAALGIQEGEIQKIQADVTQIKAQNQALATVFNQIRPWSAILQDIRDRIPANAVQIESIKQVTAAAAPAPTASPPPQGQAVPAAPPSNGLEITGNARTFNDVNDFLLSLKQSSFLKPDDTRIVKAELVNASGGQFATPALVKYTISSNFSDAGATELLRELERKGTLGLVTRIRTLQQRGLIQQ